MTKRGGLATWSLLLASVRVRNVERRSETNAKVGRFLGSLFPRYMAGRDSAYPFSLAIQTAI